MRYDYFSTPNVRNSYYAGFIAADGCIDKRGNSYRLRFEIQYRDKEILENFLSDIQSDAIVHKRSSNMKNRQDTAVLDLTISHSVVEDLYTHYSITPAKTLTLCPPKCLNTDYISAFIIGYIDGDGCIRKVNRNSKYTGYLSLELAGTELMMQWIKGFCDSNFPATRGNRLAKVYSSLKKNYRYIVNGKRAENIISTLNTINVPKLARKWCKIWAG
jgi:hypothetical protein